MLTDLLQFKWKVLSADKKNIRKIYRYNISTSRIPQYFDEPFPKHKELKYPDVTLVIKNVLFRKEGELLVLYYDDSYVVYFMKQMSNSIIKLSPCEIDENSLNHHILIIKNAEEYFILLYYKNIIIFKNKMEKIFSSV